MAAFKDLKGERFGKLTVLTRGPNTPQGACRWRSRCDCGNLTLVRTAKLRNGTTRSCGCLAKNNLDHSIKDRKGLRYGRLLVVKQSSKNKFGHICWECLCDCGNTRVVDGGLLESKNTQSCGCLKKETAGKQSITHGMSRQPGRGSPIYDAYYNMLKRCYSAKSPRYATYGGRGIKVCDRWRESFENFLADLGSRPSPKHSIDRIDVNGNYEPSNVKWSSPREQYLNKQNTVWVIYQGVITALSALGDSIGVRGHTIERCLKRGMSIEAAMQHLTNVKASGGKRGPYRGKVWRITKRPLGEKKRKMSALVMVTRPVA